MWKKFGINKSVFRSTLVMDLQQRARTMVAFNQNQSKIVHIHFPLPSSLFPRNIFWWKIREILTSFRISLSFDIHFIILFFAHIYLSRTWAARENIGVHRFMLNEIKIKIEKREREKRAHAKNWGVNHLNILFDVNTKKEDIFTFWQCFACFASLRLFSTYWEMITRTVHKFTCEYKDWLPTRPSDKQSYLSFARSLAPSQCSFVCACCFR